MANGGIKIIIAFAIGFALAQIIKFVLGIFDKKIRKRHFRDYKSAFSYLMKSGGMPSGHAASTMAVATCIGMMEGFDSVIFGLSVTIVLTVIYDAVNVRYAVGEQGKILNIISPKKTKVVEGHTFWQVLVGILLGIGVGILVFVGF